MKRPNVGFRAKKRGYKAVTTKKPKKNRLKKSIFIRDNPEQPDLSRGRDFVDLKHEMIVTMVRVHEAYCYNVTSFQLLLMTFMRAVERRKPHALFPNTPFVTATEALGALQEMGYIATTEGKDKFKVLEGLRVLRREGFIVQEAMHEDKRAKPYRLPVGGMMNRFFE